MYKRNIDELLLAGLTLIFGVSGVLFVNSQIWDMQWWLWHFLRLFAYSLALYYLYFEFDKEIQEIEKANKKLTQANKKINNYLNLIDKNIISSSTDLSGNILDVSEVFCIISGYSKNELIGKKHNIVKHEDVDQSVYKNLWETIKQDKIWKGRLKNKCKDGSFYWVEATISPTYNEKNRKIGYTAIRQDITDKIRIEELSITDGLTGIYNRRHFDDIFPKVVNTSMRNNELVTFIIMDIDYFKQYNDMYGHQKGDEVLMQVSHTIQNTLSRADDYCFRLGGEEFGVIYKTLSKQKAVEFANTIRKNIQNLHIQHELSEINDYVTVSIGVICQNAKDIENVDVMYSQADKLLYTAKKNGRNQVASNLE